MEIVHDTARIVLVAWNDIARCKTTLDDIKENHMT